MDSREELREWCGALEISSTWWSLGLQAAPSGEGVESADRDGVGVGWVRECVGACVCVWWSELHFFSDALKWSSCVELVQVVVVVWLWCAGGDVVCCVVVVVVIVVGHCGRSGRSKSWSSCLACGGPRGGVWSCVVVVVAVVVCGVGETTKCLALAMVRPPILVRRNRQMYLILNRSRSDCSRLVCTCLCSLWRSATSNTHT